MLGWSHAQPDQYHIKSRLNSFRKNLKCSPTNRTFHRNLIHKHLTDQNQRLMNMGDSQLQNTKTSDLNHINTHWLNSQDGEKGSSKLTPLLWIFLNCFSEFSVNFSVNFSLFSLSDFSVFLSGLITTRMKEKETNTWTGVSDECPACKPKQEWEWTASILLHHFCPMK